MAAEALMILISNARLQLALKLHAPLVLERLPMIA
jgi:hypothetical protein